MITPQIEIERLADLIRKLQEARFYGQAQLMFEHGHVVHGQITQSIKMEPCPDLVVVKFDIEVVRHG